MQNRSNLQAILKRIDGRGYKAYKELKGIYDYGDYRLIVDHVQGDPYAAPSRVRVTLPQDRAGFSPTHYATPPRRLALEDFLIRAFHDAAARTTKGLRGIGKSGLIGIDCGGQEVLERSALFVSDREVEARFVMGLPARGRTILGRDALDMFLREVPEIVSQSLYYRSLDEKALLSQLAVVEDQAFIRDALETEGLVAFVADGSLLPRRSGIDDRPLTERPVPFASPDSLRCAFTTPNRGTVHGMGIPDGITLIVGGGFHGKSTLLNALNRSVYPHIPGDGREYVVTDPTAVKIRAEDGRSVTGVDISPFIQNLPFGKETEFFSTPNASGSTSQAANIMEALEMGSRLLLIDEDTSATNFMIRDERMQALVAKEKEPITPFVDKVRQLREELGVSTILVMGGSGDYLDCADRVLMMEAYRPVDVTAQARAVVQTHASRRKSEGGGRFGAIRIRSARPEGFDPRRGRRDVRIDARGVQEILFGRETIALGAVEQLVDISQTRAIGDLIHYYSKNHAKSTSSIQEGLARSLQDVQERGFDLLSPYRLGSYAMPRLFEVAAAVNRMRSLRIKRPRNRDGEPSEKEKK